MTVEQHAALNALVEAGSAASAAVVRDALGIDRGAAWRIVRALSRAGYVRRARRYGRTLVVVQQADGSRPAPPPINRETVPEAVWCELEPIDQRQLGVGLLKLLAGGAIAPGPLRDEIEDLTRVAAPLFLPGGLHG